jgi:hypothetical protein
VPGPGATIVSIRATFLSSGYEPLFIMPDRTDN